MASVPVAFAGPVAVGVAGPPDVKLILMSDVAAVGAKMEIVRVPAALEIVFEVS